MRTDTRGPAVGLSSCPEDLSRRIGGVIVRRTLILFEQLTRFRAENYLVPEDTHP